jgi:hypothetical protein
MSQSEARAWWADVEEVRATIERRRAAERGMGDAGRGQAAFADVDDLAVRRRFRDRARAHDDADVWFDEPAATRGSMHPRGSAGSSTGGRSAAGPRSRASGAGSPPDRRAAMAALAPAPPAPQESTAAPRETRAAPRETTASPRETTASPHDATAAPAAAPAAPRRTVQITGRTVPAPHVVPFDHVGPARRRPSRAPAALAGPRPDRIAMWAVVLGFVLIAVAATSAHGATGPVPPSATPAVQHVAAPAVAPAAPPSPQRR